MKSIAYKQKNSYMKQLYIDALIGVKPTYRMVKNQIYGYLIEFCDNQYKLEYNFKKTELEKKTIEQLKTLYILCKEDIATPI